MLLEQSRSAAERTAGGREALGAERAASRVAGASAGLELGLLLGRHAARGDALPVAVTISLVDDLAAAVEAAEAERVAAPLSAALPGFGEARAVVDARGVARWDQPPLQPVPALLGVLRSALEGGVGDRAVPPAARPLVADAERITSAARLRVELRRALGAPASRDEVVAAVQRVVAVEPVSAASTSTGAREASALLAEGYASSLVPSVPELASDAPSPVPAHISEPGARASDAQTIAPRSLRAPVLPEDAEPTPPLLPTARPVSNARGGDTPRDAATPSDGPRVRHEPPRRKPVSLPSAPPARLGPASLRPDEERASMIELPSEDRGRLVLLGVLAGASVAVVSWLLGLWP